MQVPPRSLVDLLLQDTDTTGITGTTGVHGQQGPRIEDPVRLEKLKKNSG